MLCLLPMLRFVKIHIYKHFLLHFTNRLLLKTTYGQLKQKLPFGTQTNSILATTLGGIGDFCLSSTSMWYPQWLAKTNKFVEHFGELWKICGEVLGIVENFGGLWGMNCVELWRISRSVCATIGNKYLQPMPYHIVLLHTTEDSMSHVYFHRRWSSYSMFRVPRFHHSSYVTKIAP
jgi:hypothetical protein